MLAYELEAGALRKRKKGFKRSVRKKITGLTLLLGLNVYKFFLMSIQQNMLYILFWKISLGNV